VALRMVRPPVRSCRTYRNDILWYHSGSPILVQT
jgi:hypothetical protein